eukprot:TRINITY_DN1462_c0_g1_i1.p1 TRINITY_DN1462_c0_g1~~TRINITY_DN1462_c0_g1_i1.p1  ORF type:complete len:164 (+),score=17.57 TRINITY_DN1462_c0_g1_i1:685-1176(+)
MYDTSLSSYMEQFMQSALYFYGTSTAVIRALEIDDQFCNMVVELFISLCLLVHWLIIGSTVNFEYNLLICLFHAIFQTILWLMWYWIRGREPSRKPFSWKLYWSIYLFWVMSIFELVDFIPFFGILDAHAIWHFGTILPWFLFWSAMLEDSIYEELWQKKYGW